MPAPDTNGNDSSASERWAYSVDETRELLGGVSRGTLDRALADGTLYSCRLRDRVLVPIWSINCFLNLPGHEHCNINAHKEVGQEQITA